MIYGRFGQPVTIVRIGTLQDVIDLDNRKPDQQDKEAVELGSYVVVKDGEKLRLYHQAFLRADGGAKEIAKTIAGLTKHEKSSN